jgi:hypothetical protein
MKKCLNKKCREAMSPEDAHIFCVSCRFIAKWMFGAGAFLVGAAWTLFHLLAHK